ncbi:hypothetical protein [Actinocorallia sp. A-T 12471]|uniref:DUF7927 domain-containing protein n=1 Tax=Actinocorallia sp. A-T 12471 TaxID=3089813 RepID=UPI0029D127A0|nr:hypothetical protein [Actinocorallia sp. A-T 12471]MDX6742255.1 hypothetical protein [Actinocorallia sp. A-T 12471]
MGIFSRRRSTRCGTALVAALTALAVAAQPAFAAIPTPGPNQIAIAVKVGDRRVTELDVSPLAGVRLALYRDAAGTNPFGAECVSDADGDCTFLIPNTGLPIFQPLYIGQVSVPAGYYTNPVLSIGPYRPPTQTFSFTTPGGTTYRSGVNFMTPPTSTGFIQQSRVNPPLPDRCGMDVAVVMDLSASIELDLARLKAATTSFAQSLVGTPSRMAVFSFASMSPAESGANYPDLIPVSTQEGVNAFTAQYAPWRAEGGTNWDQGLWRTAEAVEDYDLVLFVTDGFPTYWDALQGTGGSTRFGEIEGGVFAANAAKARGSRVVAMGIGLGAGAELNLRTISGPTPFDGGNIADADYFSADDVGSVAEAMRELARARCQSSVSVVKMIAPDTTTGEDVRGAEPAGAGWTFDAVAAAPGTTVDPASATTEDNGTGAVSFRVESATGPGRVQITERQQDGFGLVTQGGANAVCTDTDTGDPVAVENAGALGFAVDVPQGDGVTCRVYNRPVGTQSVVVDKEWDINGESYPDADVPEGFSARLTLTGPGDLPASEQDFADPRDGYSVGEVFTIDEEVTVPESCSVVSREVTGGPVTDAPLPYQATVAEGDNAYRIVNTVTCTQGEPRLSVAKEADRMDAGGGETVTYTVTATNTGDGDFTADDPAYFTDDLSEVLRAAAYNQDVTASSGNASYAEPVVSWRGVLAAGESVTVRYSVTVDAGAGGRRVCNTVTALLDQDTATTCLTLTGRPDKPHKPGKPGKHSKHGKPGKHGIPWPSGPWPVPWPERMDDRPKHRAHHCEKVRKRCHGRRA